MPERLVKDGTVTVASKFKSVLLTFFSQEDLGWNMERIGVKLKCSRGDFVLRSTSGCLLADEKGIKECLSLKGASGSKPFCFCRNVVGRADFFRDHRYSAHVASTDVAKFDLHSQSSFDELCTLLASEVRAGSTRGKVDQVERALGIKYDKNAVAFCPAASKVAMIPESVFPDSMHNMLASGGVLQFELNQEAFHLAPVLSCRSKIG